jgi:hypothetical protein
MFLKDLYNYVKYCILCREIYLSFVLLSDFRRAVYFVGGILTTCGQVVCVVHIRINICTR